MKKKLTQSKKNSTDTLSNKKKSININTDASSQLKKNKNNLIKIGFDFDKVFVNYPPLIPDAIIEWLYKKKSTTLKYRNPGKFEQQVRVLSHHPIFRHPIIDNIEALKKIHSQNKSIHLISGRLGFLKNRTAQWMKKYDFEKYFESVNFNFKNEQAHMYKNRMIQELKITHFVDDDLDLLIYLAKHNPKIMFYWINSSRLTKRYIPFENIKKIQSISELKI